MTCNIYAFKISRYAPECIESKLKLYWEEQSWNKDVISLGIWETVPTLFLIGAALCKVPASLLFQVHYFPFYVLFFSVKYPAAITTVIEADYHQKVVMKFSLKSVSSGDLFTPHQAFVRLTNEKTKQEIFFVAEPEPSKVFKFDLVSES